MDIFPLYDAQESIEEHLLETQKVFEMGVGLESNEPEYWVLANYISRTVFAYISQLSDGDDAAQQAKTIAQARYVLMRLRKCDLIDEFDDATEQQGYEIYILITRFKLFLMAVIQLDDK